MIRLSAILDILTAVATMLAAIYAGKSSRTSARQLNTQLKEQEKVERPRLVPLNKQVISEVPFVLADWVLDFEGKMKRLRSRDKFSGYTIPIINTGKSFAIDIRYSYEIENGVHAIQSKSYRDHLIVGPSPDEKMTDASLFTFDIKAMYTLTDPGRYHTFTAESTPYIRYVPIIQSGEKAELLIPSYFVVLSNIYLKNYWEYEQHELIRPKLKLTIWYKDQYNQEHEDYFRVELAQRQMATKGEMIEAWIAVEKINV